MFLHQTTTYSIEVVDNQKETIDFSNKKWLCRQYFHANILKKFQLNGFKKSFFLCFTSSYTLWLYLCLSLSTSNHQLLQGYITIGKEMP